MKIGIAGNGKIVGEMIGAATTVEGIAIEAICAREKSRAKAEKIADEYGIVKVYTDYTSLKSIRIIVKCLPTAISTLFM